MSEFVEFVKNLNRDRYDRLIQRLISEKTPCGIFLYGKKREQVLETIEQTEETRLKLEELYYA